MPTSKPISGTAWTYPSDHFPIGLSLQRNGNEGVEIISWNILNSMWMGYIDNKNDPQGLRESPLVKWHKNQINEWTEREHRIGDIVIFMLHPFKTKVICLQECSKKMLELLEKRIERAFPHRYKILHSEMKYNDLGIVIYDQSKLIVSQWKAIHGIYSDDSDNFIIDTQFENENSSLKFRVVSTHIPGGEASKGKDELGCYLNANFNPAITTVILGDMNQTSEKIHEAILKFFNGISKFELVPTPYFTHVNTKKEPADFDQIYLYKSEENDEASPSYLPSMDVVADFTIHQIGFNKQFLEMQQKGD